MWKLLPGKYHMVSGVGRGLTIIKELSYQTRIIAILNMTKHYIVHLRCIHGTLRDV